MGHISHEPSMEEILSSIKRIIAEDVDTPALRSRRPGPRAVAVEPVEDDPESLDIAPEEDDDDSEILELTDAVEPTLADPAPATPPPATSPVEDPAMEAPVPAKTPAVRAVPKATEELVSATAANASRDALASLSRLIVKPEDIAADNTLEGMVRDMLRPMLKDWLDAKLPELVEAMVAKEIARITGQAL